jgi:hypothetical protein
MSEQLTAPPFNVNRFQLGARVTALRFPMVGKPDQASQVPEFKAPAASDLGTPRFFAMQLDEIMLPNEPLITVSSSKNIVKTVIPDVDFTVKEIISADDWKVKIQGYAVKEGDRGRAVANSLVPEDYPEEWLRRIIMLYRRNRRLEVKCQLMTYYNITHLVIEDIEFPAIPGASDYFAYQFTACSDESTLGKLIRKK